MTAPKYRRYPAAPILPLVEGLGIKEAGLRAGVSKNRIQQWRQDPGIQIEEYEADRIAVTLGVHPGELWEDWFNINTPIKSWRRHKQQA